MHLQCKQQQLIETTISIRIVDHCNKTNGRTTSSHEHQQKRNDLILSQIPLCSHATQTTQLRRLFLFLLQVFTFSYNTTYASHSFPALPHNYTSTSTISALQTNVGTTTTPTSINTDIVTTTKTQRHLRHEKKSFSSFLPTPSPSHSYNPPDGIPRSLIMEGCSGSSAVSRFAHEIMAAHGLNIHLHEFGNNELLIPHKNRYYDSAYDTLYKQNDRGGKDQEPNYDDVIVEAIKELNDETFSRGRVFYFKSNTRYLYPPHTVIQGLQQTTHVRFGHMIRTNLLDRAICDIRDCFYGTKFGYPVFAANKTRTDLCFSRRKVSDAIQAHVFDLDAFISYMLYIQEDDEIARDMLKDVIYPGSTQEYETLFAYEYTSSERIFQSSLQAWVELMRSLVDDINYDIVDALMRNSQNTRIPPLPHSELIDNMKQVKKKLKEYHLDSYIREDVSVSS